MFKTLFKKFPHTYKSGIIIASIFFILGVSVIGVYASAVDYTNSLEFCATTCHEMSIPYSEYKNSKHYQNSYGVRAECPDCHVPHKKWQFTLVAKMGATADLFEHLFGHISRAPDVAAQFESDRLGLAKVVWARMKETDSRECRNCHSFEAMVLAAQPMRAQGQHEFAQKKNMTCIDCHKGLVHKPIHQQLEKPAEPESFE